MSNSVRLKRLQNDYEQLLALHNRNGLIQIIAAEGNPPERYVIGFHCRGIADINSKGNPKIIDEHRVELALTIDYPRLRPQAIWRTPIFHPNFNNGAICWEWYPQQSLRETCEVFCEMVQYKNYNSTSPLNMDASLWAMEHRDEFPIDTQNLFDTPNKYPSNKEISRSIYDRSVVVVNTIPLFPENPSQNEAPAPFCGNCGFEFFSAQSFFCPQCGEARKKISPD